MRHNFKKFCIEIYQKSGGFIPFWPLTSTVALGDLVIIKSGQMFKLGNISDLGLREEMTIEKDTTESWNLQSGVQESFRSEWNINDAKIDQFGLKLEFESVGDYIFSAHGIEKESISNFHQIEFRLLQWLSSEKFSFKEIYVVTSVGQTDMYSILLASKNNAYALISGNSETQEYCTYSDLVKRKTSFQIKEMESVVSLKSGQEKGCSFFKAQKMEVSNKGKEVAGKFIKDTLPNNMSANVSEILRFASIEMLPSADIYPANVHELFHFREMNLNDIEDFFGNNYA